MFPKRPEVCAHSANARFWRWAICSVASYIVGCSAYSSTHDFGDGQFVVLQVTLLVTVHDPPTHVLGAGQFVVLHKTGVWTV